MKSLLEITHSLDLIGATFGRHEHNLLPPNAQKLLKLASKKGMKVLDEAIHEVMATFPECYSKRALREKSAEPVRRIKGYE